MAKKCRIILEFEIPEIDDTRWIARKIEAQLNRKLSEILGGFEEDRRSRLEALYKITSSWAETKEY